MACELAHIPVRLHTDNRPSIDTFSVGEFLFMRCDAGVVENPYKNISITELSHNRSGLDESFSVAEDVLYSIKQGEGFETYINKVVCTLQIKDLNDDCRYKKVFTQEKNGEIKQSIIELLHIPEECMYPHSVFRIWLDDQIVTYGNYDQTIKKMHEIRNKLKTELASMIIKEAVSQKSKVED